MLQAVEALGALPLVTRLPEGLDTLIGDGGHQLNAAEVQLISLMRVQLADPDIAVLDEATAEAGSTHAEMLEAAARTVLRGRSGVVVAHRLNQARASDRIVVMDSGRIVEQGDHDELLARQGRYAALWRASKNQR